MCDAVWFRLGLAKMRMQQALERSARVLQVDTLRDGSFFGEDSLLTLPPSDELLKVGVGSLLSANRGVDIVMHTPSSLTQHGQVLCGGLLCWQA